MNWSKLTYKQRKRLLWLASIVALLICYQYAFKKTWEIYGEYKENNDKAARSVDHLQSLPRLQKEAAMINDLIKSNISDTVNKPKEMLAFIGSFCKQHKMRLMEYSPMQLADGSDFNIATSQVTVEGYYKGLLKLIYELENHQSYGRLRAASFKSTEDPYTGNISLACTIYLQNLIPKIK
jgi:hypothetical protein